MRQAVWGLPQASILANKRLQQILAPFGYFECDNTPGLWYHKSRPVSFTLVVNDFRVKYIGKEHTMHLIESIKKTYTLTEDLTGNLYCGISLEWNYINQTVNISMPNYINKKLQEYNHVLPKRPQYSPYLPKPKSIGSKAQAPLPPNNLPHLAAKRIKRIEQIVGSILYYAFPFGSPYHFGTTFFILQFCTRNEKRQMRKS